MRIEFQSRGQYTVMPDRAGADGSRARHDLRHLGRAGRLHGRAARAPLPLHRRRQRVVRRTCKEQKALWENPALSFSDEYELARPTSIGLDATAFLGQERAAVDRMSSDFARTVVSAILEAF